MTTLTAMVGVVVPCSGSTEGNDKAPLGRRDNISAFTNKRTNLAVKHTTE